MNNRLYKICSYIQDGVGVIDVGTDHGYLPIELCQRGYKGNIIASDINEDPLNKAIRAADAAGFSDRISFKLCDGLAMCDPKFVDRIVIAGMGGDTICAILEAARWCYDSNYTLYLQPMSKSEILRAWLVSNGFDIICEDIVIDNDTMYQIISARYGNAKALNEAEMYIGSKNVHTDLKLYEDYRQKLIHRFKKAKEGMVNAENRDMSERIAEMELMLQQLERM